MNGKVALKEDTELKKDKKEVEIFEHELDEGIRFNKRLYDMSFIELVNDNEFIFPKKSLLNIVGLNDYLLL
jgi:hypothetical protein